MSASVSGVAVTGHRPPLQRVEAADLVEPEDVIGVAVREEDGVDAADAERQRLRAQVGSGIDQQRVPVVGLDEDRRAPAPIARIGRIDRSAQSQPIIGTPCDVPVPRKVIFNSQVR